MTGENVHQAHPDIVKRLRRAAGHLRAVVEMLEAGRSCIEIATQMQAVENAIGQAKRVLIQGHLGDCLDHALSPLTPEQRLSLREIKEITRYL